MLICVLVLCFQKDQNEITEQQKHGKHAKEARVSEKPDLISANNWQVDSCFLFFFENVHL